MALTTTINGNIQTIQSTQVPNLDSRYGPYNSITDVLNTLAQPYDVLATNGLTIGVLVDGVVEEYMFVNIVQGETPTENNLIKKVFDSNYVHTDNNFTDYYKDKLDGIEEGAEVNVQSDWTESNPTSDAFILHKPDGKMFGSVITPSSAAPSTPDANVYFIAFESGVYVNYGNFILQPGDVAFVDYKPDERSIYSDTWNVEMYTYERIGYFEVNTESELPLSTSQMNEVVKKPCFAKDQRENFYFKMNETRGYYNFFSIPNMWAEEGVINIANTGFRVSKANYTLGLLDETLFTYTTEGVQTVVETIVQEAQVGAALFQGTTDLPDDGTVTGEHWKFSTLEDYKKGQYWVVASAGTYVGQVCEPGDFVFCIADKDTSYSASNFSVIQNNIETITNNDIDTITSNLS